MTNHNDEKFARMRQERETFIQLFAEMSDGRLSDLAARLTPEGRAEFYRLVARVQDLIIRYNAVKADPSTPVGIEYATLSLLLDAARPLRSAYDTLKTLDDLK